MGSHEDREKLWPGWESNPRPPNSWPDGLVANSVAFVDLTTCPWIKLVKNNFGSEMFAYGSSLRYCGRLVVGPSSSVMLTGFVSYWSELRLIRPRLQNSRIFCERKRHRKIIFKRKVWSECRNGEGEWGETLTALRAFRKWKKTTVLQSRFARKPIRSTVIRPKQKTIRPMTLINDTSKRRTRNVNVAN